MGNPICKEHKPGALMITVERLVECRVNAFGRKIYGLRKYYKCTKYGRLKRR